ncbi:MAG TPA: hypothetical protein VFW62_11425 [bacterium]|nr:hypothetical protein [bacterium]
MHFIGLAFFLASLVFGAAACGSANGSCEDVVCLEGTSCLLEDGTPSCVPNGTSGGSGGNQAGESCETSADCATGLSCQPDLGGTLVCQE